MSNNPFKTTNNNNNQNRFAFLDIDNEPPSNKFNKKKQKNEETRDNKEKSDNIFLNPKTTENSYRDRDRIPRYFKENNKPKSASVIVPVPVPEFNISEQVFPDIVKTNKSKNSSLEEEPKISFKTVLNKVVPEEEKPVNNIKPGCVEITQVNRKIVFSYGPKTKYQLNQEYLEEVHKTPNYIMNKAITTILQNRELDRKIYDSIYGEGAYDEEHYVPPVYGPEYDTDDNSDEDIEDTEEEEY